MQLSSRGFSAMMARDLLRCATFFLLLKLTETKPNATLTYVGKLAPPVIAKRFEVEPVRYGEDLVIPCKAYYAVPPSRVRWYQHDGAGWRRVDPKYESRTSRDDVALVIRKARLDDSGTYQCVASNIAGKDKYTVEVLVGRPSLPTNRKIVCQKELYMCEMTWDVPIYAGYSNSTDFAYIITRIVDGDASQIERDVTTQKSFTFYVPSNATTVTVKLWSYTMSSGQSAYPAAVNIVWANLPEEVVAANEASLEELRRRKEEMAAYQMKLHAKYFNVTRAPPVGNRNSDWIAELVIAVAVSICAFPLFLTLCLVAQMHIRHWIHMRRRGSAGVSSAGRLPKDLAEMLNHRTPPSSLEHHVRFQEESQNGSV